MAVIDAKKEVELTKMTIQLPEQGACLPGATVKFEFAPMLPPKSVWNSLEIAKIVVGTLTPIVIAGFGIYATILVHKEDADRVAKEDVRRKKTALLPLIADLRKQNAAASHNVEVFYNDVHSAAVRDDVKTMGQMDEYFHQKYDDYYGQMIEDWHQIRVLLEGDKDEERNEIFKYFSTGVHDPYAALSRVCAAHLINGFHKVDDATWSKYLNVCTEHFKKNDNSRQCAEYVDFRLRNYYTVSTEDIPVSGPKSCVDSRAEAKKFQEDNKALFSL